jgi:hypothetical protein
MLTAVLAASIALLAATGTAIAAPPANDDFVSAETLTGYRGTASFDLTDATVQSGEPQSSGTDDRTVWFSYTPASSGLASFSICDFDAAYEIAGANLTVYTGSTLVGFTSVADSSGGCPADQVNARILELPVTAGTTYSLQVGNAAAAEITGGTLTYDFNLQHPANDDFADASEITGALPQSIDADSGLATTETDESGIDFWGPFNSLWYHWTPDADGTVSIDTCSTLSENPAVAVADSGLQVFTNTNDPADLAGASLYNSSENGCSAPNSLLSRAYIEVNAGTDYWIRVVNASDKFGAAYKLKLHWVTKPELNGTAYVYPQGTNLPIGEPVYAGVPDWYANPGVSTIDLQWQLCDADGNACSDIAGETAGTYVPVASDGGHRLRLKVTASNDAESTTEFSDASDPVESLPPVDAGDGGGNSTPPPVAIPVDPFPQPSVPKSLGKAKVSSKRMITLAKLSLLCGATATGPCTGTVTLTIPASKGGKGKVKIVKYEYATSTKPGSKLTTKIKLSSKMARAVKKAKKVKATIVIKIGAPGFSVKTIKTSVTLTG